MIVFPLASVVVWATTTGTTDVAPDPPAVMPERNSLMPFSREANCTEYWLGMALLNQSGVLDARRAEYSRESPVTLAALAAEVIKGPMTERTEGLTY